jgi:hypothetical protein
MRQCSQIKSHFHADFTQGLSSIVYVAKNHNKKVQRIAAETQNNQRITNELQDRMLQLEVSSQDQFLQLHTGLNALTEGQGLTTPHKEVVKANWEDGPNGRLAGIERNTSARKTNETIKIYKKVLPLQNNQTCCVFIADVAPSLVGRDHFGWVRSYNLHDSR